MEKADRAVATGRDTVGSELSSSQAFRTTVAP